MRAALSAVLAGCFALTAVAAAPTSAAIVHSEFVHEPGAYPQCHAATLAETASGVLVAAWFGGTRESAPDVCIWSSRLVDGHWSAETQLADGIQPDGTRFPCWNPVLFQARQGGPLLLFYKVGPSPESWWGMLRTSSDEGVTWTAAQRLPDGVLGPIKNKPIELSDGTLLCGSSTEDKTTGWQVHVERTSDLGRTWQRSPSIPAEGVLNAIQPTFLTHGVETLQMLCRTKEHVIATTTSVDRGYTWSPLKPSGLYAPNSGIDGVTLADGRHLLVYNHRDAPARGSAQSGTVGDWKSRWPLNVALSSDGTTWRMVLPLEDEPRKDGYAYPAVIQTRDHLVHVVYTWDRVKIKHIVIDPTQL